MYWIPYAFVRIVVFFSAGILLGIYFPEILSEQYAVTLFFCFLTSYAFLFLLNWKKQRSVINPGFLGLAVVFVSGYLNVLFYTHSRQDDHISRIDQSVEYYRATVADFPIEKPAYFKQVGLVSAVRIGGEWHPYQGKVLLYFSKNTFQTPYRYGDDVLIKGAFNKVQPPSNPGEFDYQRYLAFDNIHHQHYLNKDDLLHVGYDPPSVVIATAIRIRSWAEQQLSAAVHGERERALAHALVLGVVDGLDSELLGAYAATGSMHVLAVSGLHVGILYWILLLMLKPLKKYTWGKWVITVISLVVLWGYACVTGLPPSVLRAVVMFSFVAVAYPLNFRTNIYNTLAASAFCLLLFNPFLLMSVGFQLSYLAVLGIVYFQPKLYALLEPKHAVWDEIWKISCVSIAAQLSTFALGLFYFHQFPNYFLLSNLFVIPLSFFILVLGLGILAFSFISAVTFVFGYVLTWLIKLLNFLVFATEALPYSLTTNIYITTTQCWILMLLVLALCLFHRFRKVHFIYVGAALIFVFAGLSFSHVYEVTGQKKMTVYKVSGHSVIDLMEGGRTYVYTDSVLHNRTETIQYQVQNNRLMNGVYQSHPLHQQPFSRSFHGGQLTHWNGKLIVQINTPDFTLPKGLKVDFLIISSNAVRSLRTVLKEATPSYIIIDSSNSFRWAGELLEEKEKFPGDYVVHSVWHEGAFDVLI